MLKFAVEYTLGVSQRLRYNKKHMEGPSLIVPDFGRNPIEFVKEAQVELKKVIWPTKKEVGRMTILILVVSVTVGAFIGSLDYGFTNLFQIALHR